MLEFLNKTEPYLADSEVTFLSENYRYCHENKLYSNSVDIFLYSYI